MDKFKEELMGILPPFVSRKEACKALGGLISPKTFANLDSLGSGPKGRILIGRKVAYTREALVEWAISRIRKTENLSLSEGKGV